MAEQIENDLIFVGTTAIEDKLQDNVASVIESFIDTGIKVWVLTGDKPETAKSIAFSCKLFKTNQHIIELKGLTTNSEIRTIIADSINLIDKEKNSGISFSMLVDNVCLSMIMKENTLTSMVLFIS